MLSGEFSTVYSSRASQLTTSSTAEQLVEQAAKDGSMVREEWPRALRFILPRLQDIVHNHFLIPSTPAPHPEPARDRSSTPSKPENPGESIVTDKENAPPAGASDEGSALQKADGDAQASDRILPPELHELYTSIVLNLNKNFPDHAPHTLQRLAELVMSPKAHYRFLPPYLRALDRVVSVSSTTTVFPLPQSSVPSSGTTILNGVTPGSANMSSPSLGSSPNLGSDDSLGGALLTPIPWLRAENDRSGNSGSELVSESTEMVDGPNGAGRIETVSVVNGVLGTTTSAPASASSSSSPTDTASDNPPSTSNTANATTTATAPDALRDTGPITQGELLRQEQEAGIVTVAAGGASSTSSRPVTRSSGLLSSSQQSHPPDQQQSEPHAEGGQPPTVEEAEAPHARGPDVIGMEDMGPQQGGGLARGIDLEAAVGRPAPHPERSGESGKEEGEAQGGREEEMRDADDDDQDGESAKPSAAPKETSAPATQAEKSDSHGSSAAAAQQPVVPDAAAATTDVDADDDWEMLPREEEEEEEGVEAMELDKEKETDQKDDAKTAQAETEEKESSSSSTSTSKRKRESENDDTDGDGAATADKTTWQEGQGKSADAETKAETEAEAEVGAGDASQQQQQEEEEEEEGQGEQASSDADADNNNKKKRKGRCGVA
ncbi:hypothetical protein BKA81DRAFT_152933 [Phyllosticta paracitricarpa]|uniref:Protein phosphatase 4 core regulatory subunit R2 n=2 Tax=Phyllosticta TaxID=121621 RepID=A0ABR1L740_9PEZI